MFIKSTTTKTVAHTTLITGMTVTDIIARDANHAFDRALTYGERYADQENMTFNIATYRAGLEPGGTYYIIFE